MNLSTGYHITHINVSVQPLYPVINKEKGNYLVFWWNEIPLGDLFLEQNKSLTEDAYLLQLIAAIQPTIEFYHKKNSSATLTDPWQKWIKEGRFDLISSFMDNVFANYTAKNYPIKVPVSVVICTRNRADQLHTCLTLLQQLVCQPEEIIVVDNAPIDQSTLETVEKFNRVKYVKEPRIGLNIARNTGIKNAKLPIIAYVDDDVIVDSLWVYRVHETFRNTSIAAMTGLVIATELDTAAQVMFEKSWSFNRGYTDKVYDNQYINRTLSEGPPVWEIGAGANMAFRKNVFTEVGLFDEILDVGAAGCNGDSEMWFRILIAGHSIAYNPRAVVYHEHRKEIAGLKKQIFYYMRGFTAAALLQQEQLQNAGYKHHIYQVLPRYYLPKIKQSLLHYHKNDTIWVELQGIISGLVFYNRNRKKSTRSQKF